MLHAGIRRPAASQGSLPVQGHRERLEGWEPNIPEPSAGPHVQMLKARGGSRRVLGREHPALPASTRPRPPRSHEMEETISAAHTVLLAVGSNGTSTPGFHSGKAPRERNSRVRNCLQRRASHLLPCPASPAQPWPSRQGTSRWKKIHFSSTLIPLNRLAEGGMETAASSRLPVGGQQLVGWRPSLLWRRSGA